MEVMSSGGYSSSLLRKSSCLFSFTSLVMPRLKPKGKEVFVEEIAEK